MPKSKKVVLFIVEGVTEKICLESVMLRLHSDGEIKFQVMEGDLTAKWGGSPENILGEIVNRMKAKWKEYRKKDYLHVVHLLDMDGAFISDEKIINTEIERPIYLPHGIEASEKSNLPERNRRKREIVRKLASSKRIWVDIPYTAYFFSCNLDHVMHDEANLADDLKVPMAEAFEMRYADDLYGFYQFIIAASTPNEADYRQSWEFIEKGENSLHRYTNFGLYLSELYGFDSEAHT